MDFNDLLEMDIVDVTIHSKNSPTIGLLEDLHNIYKISLDYSQEIEAGLFETRLVREE